MLREMINYLTTSYSLICRGKGLVPDKQLRTIADGAHCALQTSMQVAANDHREMTKNDQEYLREAQMIDSHIEEAMVFLLSMEIC